jgi:hypothetical protein
MTELRASIAGYELQGVTNEIAMKNVEISPENSLPIPALCPNRRYLVEI